MNEVIFFLQIGVIVAALYGAYKLGKEAIIALCVLMAVLANLFVLQQITLLGWNATSSDAFAIGTLFGLNLLQQGWGRASAQKAIWISFFGMVFFVAASQVHLLFTPSSADTSQGHFAALLSSTPRLLLASLATFLIVQWLDVRLYGIGFRYWGHISWRVRSAVCLLLSQAIDTGLFSLLGLYGLVNELWSIIFVSYSIKCIVILFTAIGAAFFDPFRRLTLSHHHEI